MKKHEQETNWRRKLLRRKILQILFSTVSVAIIILVTFFIWNKIDNGREEFVSSKSNYWGIGIRSFGWSDGKLPIFFTRLYNGFFIAISIVIGLLTWLFFRLRFFRLNRRLIGNIKVTKKELSRDKVNGVQFTLRTLHPASYFNTNDSIREQFRKSLRASIIHSISEDGDKIIVTATLHRGNKKNLKEVLRRVQ